MPENLTMPEQRPSIWQKIQSILNTVNHLLIGFVGVTITILGRSLNFQDTAWHAFMTTIGIHVLMAEALMSHYPINPLTSRFSHRNKSRFHGILQLVGGLMTLLGAFGKIYNTEEHFTTLHGKIGLATTFWCCASILGGFVNYFQPKFITQKIYPPAEIKYRHNLFGILTFTLAMTSIFLGYRTQFFYKYVDAEFIPAISLATILVYVFTMIGPLKALLDKIKHRNNRKKQMKS